MLPWRWLDGTNRTGWLHDPDYVKPTKTPLETIGKELGSHAQHLDYKAYRDHKLSGLAERGARERQRDHFHTHRMPSLVTGNARF